MWDAALCHTGFIGMRASPPAPVAGRVDSSSTARDAHAGSAATEDLVVALRDRQPWAAPLLWDRYAAHVRRLLARALGPRDDVEDLTQEVFLRVFSRVHTLREAAALREFVMSVAIRVLKWELRRRWVRRVVSLSVTGRLPEVATRGANPEARDALVRCYGILDRLSARERTAFVLRYMEEMKMEEVADGLGVSVSTAKRLVSQAVVKVSKHVATDTDLRDYFADVGGEAFRAR
jgi:RNA polymerase sigma-70 factor, ECF subfamily